MMNADGHIRIKMHKEHAIAYCKANMRPLPVYPQDVPFSTMSDLPLLMRVPDDMMEVGARSSFGASYEMTVREYFNEEIEKFASACDYNVHVALIDYEGAGTKLVFMQQRVNHKQEDTRNDG